MDKLARIRITAESELPILIRQLEEVVQLQQKVLEGSLRQERGVTQALNSQSRSLSELTGQIRKQSDEQERATRQQAAALHEQERQLKSIAGEYSYLGRQVQGVKQIIIGAFTADTLMSYGRQIIQATGNMEQFQVSLEVMLQSKAKADQLMAQVAEFTRKTPFTLEQTQEATKRLLAYGVAQEDVIRTLRNLGNIAAAVGTEKLPQLITAFGQVKASGRLMGDELNQFQEAGVNLLGALAEQAGKSTRVIKEEISKGKVSFEDVRKALFSMAEEGGRFAGMMERQSTTITGQISNLSDSVTTLFARIGGSQNGLLSQVVGGLSSMFEWVGRNTNNLNAFTAYLQAGVTAFIAYKTIVEAIIRTKAQLALQTQLNAAATTAQTVATTAATATTTGFSGALSLLWTTMRNNPVSFVIGLLSSLYSAYQMVRGSSELLREEMGFQEAAIVQQQAQLMALTQVAYGAQMGTEKRRTAIQMLIKEFPEYFRGINAEAINNDQLRKIINAVNLSYEKRIALAREAYKQEQLMNQQKALYGDEQEIFNRIAESSNQRLKDAAARAQGDINRLYEIMQNEGIRAYGTVSLFNWRSIESEIRRIRDTFRSIENERQQSADRMVRITEEQKKAEMAVEDAKHAAIIAGMKKGTAAYSSELKRHEEAVRTLKGETVTKVVGLEGAVTAGQQAELTKRQKQREDAAQKAQREMEKEIASRLEILSTGEQKMSQVIRDTEAERLAEQIKAAQQVQDITQEVNQLRIKEEQERAQRILELEKRITEAQKEAVQIAIELGAKEAEEHTKLWQSKERVVLRYYIQVKEQALAALEEERRMWQERVNLYQNSTNPWDVEQLKEAQAKLAETENNINKTKLALRALMGDLSASIGETVQKVVGVMMQVMDMLAQNFLETTKVASDSLRQVSGMYDGLISENRKALEAQIKDTSLSYEQRVQLIDQAINRERELLQSKGSMLLLADQLDMAAERTQQAMDMVKTGMNTVVAFAKGDYASGIIGVAELINQAFQRKALLEQQRQLSSMAQEKMKHEQQIQLIEYEMQLREQLHQQVMQEMQEELDQYRQTKQAEMEAARDWADEQKRLASETYQHEREEIEKTYRLKKELMDRDYEDYRSLLEASELYRNQVLERWREAEVRRLQEEMERNMQRAQSAEDLAQIQHYYNEQIARVHQQYEEAKFDKSKTVALGIEQLKREKTEAEKQMEAEKTDQLIALEERYEAEVARINQQLEATINFLKEQIKQKEAETVANMTGQQQAYANYVAAAQAALAEQRKQLAVLEIRMEIVKLEAEKRKLFANKKALDAAINEMWGLIGQIEGEGVSRPHMYHGTERLRRNGHPAGRDTIPIMAHEDERIIPAYHNRRLLGLRKPPTNAQLVDGYIRYDQLMQQFPMLASGLDIPQMQLNSLRDMSALTTTGNGEVLKELRTLNETLRTKSYLTVNISKGGTTITERRAEKVDKYYTKLLTR